MKTDLSSIKNIIFDLGNVIVDLDFDATINAFLKLGLNKAVLNNQQVYSHPMFYAFEVGNISPEAFRNTVREILKNTEATDRQINDAWCAMLLNTTAERIKLLKKLGRKYRIFLFSNTNVIHINDFLHRFTEKYHFDFTSLFEKTFYSHEIHERKPDLSAFNKVIEMAGVIPEETLFVDDLKKNIEGARAAKLNAFWLKDGMELCNCFDIKALQ